MPKDALAEFLKPEEIVETHGAILFLTKTRAFKIKKPVAFAYMDFSTLDKREAAIRHELELNRRTAPELYLDVRRVTRKGAAVEFDGAGETLEWALEMQRFPKDAILDAVQAGGGLDAALIEKAILELTAFHRDRAQPREDSGGKGGILEVLNVAEAELRASIGTAFLEQDIDHLMSLSRQRLEDAGDLLEARRRGGCVRLCHGDLHLGNLVRLDARVVAFDCIEFNDSFAIIDVLYDLAFLVMDLWHRGERDLANSAFNRYLQLSPREHYSALKAFALFLSARAAVRAHVLGRQGQGAAARAFLQRAVEFLKPQDAQLFAIGGYSGTGKSTIARSLAPRIGRPPGAVILRSDALRKSMFGVAETDRLGPEAYRPEVSNEVYEHMFALANEGLAAGYDVVLDAMFFRESERARIDAMGGKGFWLEAEDAIIRARLSARRGDVSDADVAVYQRQREIDPGAIAWPRLDAGRSNDLVLHDLSERI